MSQPRTLVPEVLNEYGALVRRTFTKYLAREAERNDVYRLASDYPLRAGRSLRASLCIAAARACGASLHEAVHSAVSLELLHNAFLIHDDIEDESDERRGEPALHKRYDVPTAINAGDALLALSLRPLISNRDILGPRIAWSVMEETERMVRECVEGQALELAWRRNNATDLVEADYLQMILKKTCWYTTIHPCRVGGLIGERQALPPFRFVRFGFFLGAAFQIQDDVLNLAGDHHSYGKELNGDLWEGKRTLIVIELIRRANRTEVQRVRQFLAQPREAKTEAEVAWVRDLVQRYECIDYARRVAHELCGAAVHEFERCFGRLQDSRDKAFIGELPRWVLERS